MFKDLWRRCVVSIIAIAVIAALLIFARQPIVQCVLGLGIAALSAIAMWEYAQFAKEKGSHPQVAVLTVLSAFVTFSFLVSSEWIAPIAVFLSMLILFGLQFRAKRTGAIIDLAVSAFGLFYIALPLGMLLGIIYFPMNEDGCIWLVYLLAVTKVTDIGAYFGGSLWGRRKLAPTISPGKTVEGAAAGLLSALAVSVLFYFLKESFGWDRFHLNGIESIVLGIALGCVGQFGDLAESLLKRDANKKDSNCLPGLGGALDVVDSLLLNAPIIYFYLTLARSST